MTTMRVFCLLIPMLAVSMTAPGTARPLATTSVPVVVKTLRARYKVPALRVGAGRLDLLVALERREWPGAVVTGRFYDWRTVSRYRSHAGLHLGYDIAMPAGAPVVVGWAGTVTSIADWYGKEYGVTVRSPDGIEVTYGHLAPRVRVGDRLAVGQVVGTVVINHVDVKMRDASGAYVDFGAGQSGGSPQGLLAGGRDRFLVAWLVARNGLELTREELDRYLATRRRDRLEEKQLKRRIPDLEKTAATMARFLRQGLVSRRKLARARAALAASRGRLNELEEQLGRPRQAHLAHQRDLARLRLRAVEKQARRRGYRWSDVTTFVNDTVACDRGLSRRVARYKARHDRSRDERFASLVDQVERGRKRLRDLERLYRMGGLSMRDLEAARERQGLLEAKAEGVTHPAGRTPGGK